jgi:anti-sigma B factor antagonist
MAIVIVERQVGPVTVLELKGRLTVLEGSEALDEKFQQLIDASRIKLLIDLSQVTGIDSRGISSVVRGYISATKRGGKLTILNPSAKVRNVLEITRLLSVLESFTDEAAALAAF